MNDGLNKCWIHWFQKKTGYIIMEKIIIFLKSKSSDSSDSSNYVILISSSGFEQWTLQIYLHYHPVFSKWVWKGHSLFYKLESTLCTMKTQIVSYHHVLEHFFERIWLIWLVYASEHKQTQTVNYYVFASSMSFKMKRMEMKILLLTFFCPYESP